MELFLQELKFFLLFFPLSNFEEICLDVMFWAKFFGKLKSNDIFFKHLPNLGCSPAENTDLTSNTEFTANSIIPRPDFITQGSLSEALRPRPHTARQLFRSWTGLVVRALSSFQKKQTFETQFLLEMIASVKSMHFQRIFSPRLLPQGSSALNLKTGYF